MMNILECYGLDYLISSLLTWAISIEHKSPYIPVILAVNLLRELTDSSDSEFHEEALRLIVEKYWENISLDLLDSKYNILARLHLELQRTNFLTYGKSLRRLMNSEETDSQHKRLMFMLGLRDWREDHSDSIERQMLSCSLNKAFNDKERDQFKIFQELLELSTNFSSHESRIFFDSFDSLTIFHQWRVVQSLKNQLFESNVDSILGFNSKLLIRIVDLHEMMGEYYLLSELLVEVMKRDMSGDLLSIICNYVSRMKMEFHVCNSLRILSDIIAERFLFFRKTGAINYNAPDCLWNVLRHPCNSIDDTYVKELKRIFVFYPHSTVKENDRKMDLITCFFDAMRSMDDTQIESQTCRLLAASDQGLLNRKSIIARFIQEIDLIEVETRPTYVSSFMRYFRYIMVHGSSMDSKLTSLDILTTLFELNDTPGSRMQSETCSCFLIVAISQYWLSLEDVSNFVLSNIASPKDKKSLVFLKILLESLESTPFLLKDSNWDIYEYRCLFHGFLNTETGVYFVMGSIKLFRGPESQSFDPELMGCFSYAVQTSQFRNSLLLHFRSFTTQNQSPLFDSNVLSYFNQIFLFNPFGDLVNSEENLHHQIPRFFSQCFPLDMPNFMLSLAFLNLYIESNAYLSRLRNELIQAIVNILSSNDSDGASELLGLCELILSKRTLDELCQRFFISVLDDSFKFQLKLFSKSRRSILPKMLQLFSESDLGIRKHLFCLFASVLKSRAFLLLDVLCSTHGDISIETTEMVTLFIASGGLHYNLDWLESDELYEVVQSLLNLVSLSDLIGCPDLSYFLVDALVNCIDILKLDQFSSHYLHSIDKILLNPKIPDYTRDHLEDRLFFSSTLAPLQGLRIGRRSERHFHTALETFNSNSCFLESPKDLLEQDMETNEVSSEKNSSSKSWPSQYDVSRIAFRKLSPVMWVEDYPETTRSSLALSTFEGVSFPRSSEIVYEKQFRIGLQRRNMR